MKKRILSIVLITAMIVMLLPTVALARNCENTTISKAVAWDDGSLKSIDLVYDWSPSGDEHLYVAVFDEHTESNDDEDEYWFQYDYYDHTDETSIEPSLTDFVFFASTKCRKLQKKCRMLQTTFCRLLQSLQQGLLDPAATTAYIKY